MSQSIVTTAKIVRHLVLQQVQSISEDFYDVQPDCFNNAIRWNVDHIVFWMDSIISKCFSVDSQLPESYARWFNTGTKPSDGTDELPSKETLLGYLTQQFSTVTELSAQSLDETLVEPFELGALRLESAGELFNFGFIHEAIHLSTISSMLRVIKHENRTSLCTSQ